MRSFQLSSSYLALTEASRRDLATLSRDREKIVRELKRLQAENDNLVGRHSVLSEQMASEVINLPDTMEDMQLLLLTYREDLIAAKLGKERAEERLVKEVGILRSQLAGEQQTRLGQERQMKGEIQDLHSKVGTLEEMRGELAKEKDRRRVVEEERRRLEVQQEEASKEKEQQAAEAASQSSGLSAEVINLRSKVSSLQLDLDNSVAVQNDFVRLSQSLQVELEKIRQAETEVRWQHEEDVEECNNCRGQFSVTRRKHHCRHCGRIFCTDCVTKQVGILLLVLSSVLSCQHGRFCLDPVAGPARCVTCVTLSSVITRLRTSPTSLPHSQSDRPLQHTFRIEVEAGKI